MFSRLDSLSGLFVIEIRNRSFGVREASVRVRFIGRVYGSRFRFRFRVSKV